MRGRLCRMIEWSVKGQREWRVQYKTHRNQTKLEGNEWGRSQIFALIEFWGEFQFSYSRKILVIMQNIFSENLPSFSRFPLLPFTIKRLTSVRKITFCQWLHKNLRAHEIQYFRVVRVQHNFTFSAHTTLSRFAFLSFFYFTSISIPALHSISVHLWNQNIQFNSNKPLAVWNLNDCTFHLRSLRKYEPTANCNEIQILWSLRQWSVQTEQKKNHCIWWTEAVEPSSVVFTK